jgi:hypothetical protein
MMTPENTAKNKHLNPVMFSSSLEHKILHNVVSNINNSAIYLICV